MLETFQATVQRNGSAYGGSRVKLYIYRDGYLSDKKLWRLTMLSKIQILLARLQ